MNAYLSIHLLPYPRGPVSEASVEVLLGGEGPAGRGCCWRGKGRLLDVVIDDSWSLEETDRWVGWGKVGMVAEGEGVWLSMRQGHVYLAAQIFFRCGCFYHLRERLRVRVTG